MIRLGTTGSAQHFSPMTRYYFDIVMNGGTTADDEGMDLADIQAAQVEASRSLSDASENLFREGFSPDLAIEVRDEIGPVLRAAIKFEIKRVN